MCPLRFILVFLSATLAGYFAWKSMRSKTEEDESCDIGDRAETRQETVCFLNKFPSKLVAGFWIFVDMASGKYLWRNLRSGGGAAKKES